MTTHVPCTFCTDGTLPSVQWDGTPSRDVCWHCLGCRQVLTPEASAEIKRLRDEFDLTWNQAYERVVHPPIPYLSGAAA